MTLLKIRKNSFLIKININLISSLYGLQYYLNDYPVCRMPAKLDESDIKLKLAIAQRFRGIRQGLGKTQEDFAHGYGRDKQSLSKNERGQGASIYTISKFCLENGISLSEFFSTKEFDFLKPKKK